MNKISIKACSAYRQNLRIICLSVMLLIVQACGGGGGGGDDGGNTNPPPPTDTTPPESPGISLTTISSQNVDNFTIGLFAAEVGTTAFWSFTDTNSAVVEGSATITSPPDITGIDLSALIDGPIVFEIYLEDSAGNQSETRSLLIGKDATAPMAYTINAGFLEINDANQSDFSFTINTSPDNIGTSFNYRFIDLNLDEVSNSGEVTTESQIVSGINLSALATGDITLEVWLVDPAGNIGVTESSVIPKTSASGLITLSGVITFDFIPINQITNGLNYLLISERSVKEVEVQLLDASDNLLQTTRTDNQGQYNFTVSANTDVRVRVLAKLVGAEGFWDFSVTDNTQSNALYTMQGNLASTGTNDSSRNLHAESGWTGNSYSQPRVAAPFAILDAVYDSIQLIVAEDPDIVFPSAEVRWSVNNNPSDGDLEDGDIGNAFYSGSSRSIYLLGAEDIETDEYDRHVIAHEWCHYLQDQLSRSDSVGGAHTIGESLDMRVAFGEGFCNGFAAMAIGDAIYRDSSGNRQSVGFSLDIEDNNVSNAGWYNELSISTIVYDVFDDNNDGTDNISQGFSELYTALTDSDLLDADSFTSIYLYLEVLKQQYALDNPSVNTVIENLAEEQDIVSNDEIGTGETNDSGNPNTLPVYQSLSIGGSAVNVCSFDEFGTRNKLGNRRFILFTVPSNDNHTITITRTSGDIDTDPDYFVHYRGGIIEIGLSSVPDVETQNHDFIAGNYVLEVFDDSNRLSDEGKNVCFDVTII